MELARMTSKGQLTIPVSIRKKFSIGTGDQLLFYEHDGHIILAPVTPASLAAAQEAAAKQHIYALDEIRSIALILLLQCEHLIEIIYYGKYRTAMFQDRIVLF